MPDAGGAGPPDVRDIPVSDCRHRTETPGKFSEGWPRRARANAKFVQEEFSHTGGQRAGGFARSRRRNEHDTCAYPRATRPAAHDHAGANYCRASHERPGGGGQCQPTRRAGHRCQFAHLTGSPALCVNQPLAALPSNRFSACSNSQAASLIDRFGMEMGAATASFDTSPSTNSHETV